MGLDVKKLRQAARYGRVIWRYHALVRARQRGISRAEALRVLREGDVLEVRPPATPFPKCLMMQLTKSGRPLYVSAAYDELSQFAYVITVHWLDPRKWEDPWTRRREGA